MILLHLHAVWRRASSLPVRRFPCRRSPKPVTSHQSRVTSGASLAFSRFLCILAAVFLAIAAAHAQETNPPALQYSPTPILSQAVETNQPPPLPPPIVETAPAQTAPSYPFIETNQPPPLPPPAVETAPARSLAGTSQLARPSAVPLSTVPPLLHWGPLTLESHLLYSLSYGNGLQASPGQQSSSFINEFDPGILFQWGSHWSLDYTPILRFYSSRAFRNTFDNAVSLAGSTAYEDWSFGLSQSYASSSEPLIETAAQTDQQTFSTGLSAARQVGSQTSLELGASQSFRYLDNPVPGEQGDTLSWATMDWLNYQFWSRLGAAIGVGFGYDKVPGSTDMTSEQLQGRITWTVVNKLSFVVSGGAEDRQFLAPGVPDLISPIFSFSAQYSLFETTTLSLSASHTVSPSFFSDQVTEGTSISAGLHQRLLGKLFLDLSGGYGTSTYHASSTAPGNPNISNYDSTSFSAGLSLPVLKRGSAAVFYSVNYNSSGGANYNYTTTQVGLQLSYRY